MSVYIFFYINEGLFCLKKTFLNYYVSFKFSMNEDFKGGGRKNSKYQSTSALIFSHDNLDNLFLNEGISFAIKI